MASIKKLEQPKEPKKKEKPPVSLVEKFKVISSLSTELDKKNDTTNSLMRLGDKVGKPIDSIKTCLPTLDNDVLECGGIPRGGIIEIFGPESAGKTTVTLHIIGCEQKQAGGVCAFIDAEHTLDPTYASYLGVDMDNLVINQPNSGEQALDTVDQLIKSKCVSLIVVDSVAALVPEAELAGEIGEAHMGLQARMMSQAMRMLAGECRRNNVALIFINQIREKIGIMFGNPETTPGGRALKFYTKVRIDVRRRKEIKNGEVLIGHTLELKAVKNKVGRPFQSTVLDLYYPGVTNHPGLDVVGDAISYAMAHGVFEMSGSYYSFNGERLANGAANLKSFLRENLDMLEVIQRKIDELSNRKT